jgi:hypothetical protein
VEKQEVAVLSRVFMLRSISLSLGRDRRIETRHKTVEENLDSMGKAQRIKQDTHPSPVSEYSHVIATEAKYSIAGPQC